jgi:riboflavin kinase / FMN adenylyltransferase
MTIYSGALLIGTPPPFSVVCIGNFDGLHRGHQALVDRTTQLAQQLGCPAVVYTFDPHPAQVLFPERGHKALFSREDLAHQLERHHVNIAIFEPFTKSFAALSPERFVADYLVQWLKPRFVVVGEDFNFGNQRSGSVSLLQELAKPLGFAVEVVPPVFWAGEVVSSSRIRRAVQDGNMELAQDLLGRPFSLQGIVQSGAGRGKSIGIPTANLRPPDVILPKRGVYATAVEIEAGKVLPSVTNIGVAPTFSHTNQVMVETHILDQNLTLLGTALTVHFLSYLREERKFAGVAELTLQIQNDIARARSVWSKHGEMGSPRP